MKKIAFLFLTRKNIIQKKYWENFFDGVDKKLYSIYIHPDKEYAPNKEDLFFDCYIKDREIKNQGLYLEAQKKLLQESIKEKDNYKFILCADDCVPIVNFEEFYSKITSDDRSNIRYGDSWIKPGEPRYINELPQNMQKANAQWFVLNKKHAEIMANENEYYNIFKKYIISCEHYPASLFFKLGMLNESEIINKDIIHERFTKYGGTDYSKESKSFVLNAIKEAKENGYLILRKFTLDYNKILIDYKNE